MNTAIAHDPVNSPSHYISENGLEVIDIIEAYGLADSFHLGSAMKYMLRAGDKVAPGQTPQEAKIQDLGKAAYYCRRFNVKTSLHDEDFCWPSAPEDVEEMFPIEAIVREFKLEGSLAEAVGDLLNLCIGDDAEPLEQCIENIERAIKEVDLA